MSDRLHIAHFTNTYLPNINGVARSVSTFRKALTAAGHNVFVFAQEAGDYVDEDPFIFRYPGVNIPKFNYSLTMPASHFVSTLLPSLKLDVIHSNHPVLLGNVALSKAEELNVPLVFTFHTQYDEYSHYVPFNQGFVKGVIAEWLVRYLQRCHHIVTPSDGIHEILLESGVRGPITTVPTGIDLAPFQSGDGEAVRRQLGWSDVRVLVSAGRLASEKNWVTLLHAVAAVMGERPDVRLVLLGDGPQRRELEALTEQLNIAKQVHFTGVVPFDRMPDYLRAADLFCFASVTETQGLVTMEAMAAGLPVVAVDAVGTDDIVTHGKEGLLTTNDADALAAAIGRVLDDDDLRADLAANGAAHAQRLDMMHQADRMVAVYRQAMVDRRAGRTVRVDAGPISTRLSDYLRILGQRVFDSA